MTGIGFSEIFNILLSGGLIASFVGILTLRSTVQKAKGDAEAVSLTNTESATRILVENIVQPLKDQLQETRDELQQTRKGLIDARREMLLLRRAVEMANGCQYSYICPVLNRLRDQPEGGEAGDGDNDGSASYGQHRGRNPPYKDGEGSAVGDLSAHTCGQPP